MNDSSILILGGFGGKYTNDSFEFNVQTRNITKTRNQLPENVFPFAVPTVSDQQTQTAYTIDWVTFKCFQFSKGRWELKQSLKSQNQYETH